MVSLMWFRDDLRLNDNAALTWAAQRGPLVGLFVREVGTGVRPLGAAARWWQQRSVWKLQQVLAEVGVELIVAEGDARVVVPEVVDKLGATAVTWNRRYHLPMREVDADIKAALNAIGIEVTSHAGYLLNEPWTLHTSSGGPYRVFTPFVKAAHAGLTDHPPVPLPAPELTGAVPSGIASQTFPPEPFWAADTLAETCTPGEEEALRRFRHFLDKPASGHGYKEQHDIPSAAATSGLSAHLRFGEISPAYVWSETVRFADEHPAAAADAWAFLRQLLWRDFAWHRLYHLPDMATENVREQFDAFPWAWSGNAVPGASPSAFAHPDMEPDADARQHLAELAAWQRGETGVPLVDAGMRELWATGTVHNRVRMVAGSWLTKNLGIHWRHGEEWFWDTLVDADYASNPFNWQWVAGCGDDAAPYFRVFNPLLQEEKFDPDGLYVNRWVPERHTPMYPEPMVDVKASRKTALAAYNDICGSGDK